MGAGGDLLAVGPAGVDTSCLLVSRPAGACASRPCLLVTRPAGTGASRPMTVEAGGEYPGAGPVGAGASLPRSDVGGGGRVPVSAVGAGGNAGLPSLVGSVAGNFSSFLLTSDCDGGHSEGEGGRPSVLGGIRGGVKEGVFRGGVT